MKNKPQRHKETNAFRFKTFGERINEIDLRRSALYRIRHENEGTDGEDGAETEFHQTYCKWIVLNLTEEYNAFQKEIRGIVTLPQLLLKKDFVVTTLVNALEKATSLSLQPLLEFVTALARDLRDEFYAYFVNGERSILATIIKLLSTTEAEPLEWALVCLAHLFKILKPYLKKDFSSVFEAVLPLLDDHAEHITNFAVECFAFVARDIGDKERFLMGILSKICNRDECNDQITRGCGQLMFEVCRGVNGQFHSCADAYLRCYLDLILKLPATKSAILFDIFGHMINVLLQHTSPAHMQTLWDAFYYALAQFKAANFNERTFQQLITLMGQTIETKDGKFLTNPNQFVTEVTKAIDIADNNENCSNCIANLVTVLLMAKHIVLTQLDASRVCKKVLTIPSASVFEAFVWNCVDYSQFEILILPEFLRYIDSKHFGHSSLELMAKIIMHKAPLMESGIGLPNQKTYPIRMRSGKCVEKLQAILNHDDAAFLTNPREFLLALLIYPHIIGVNVKPILAIVNERIDKCLTALKPNDSSETAIDTAATVTVDRTQNQRIIFILSILIETQIQLRELCGTGKQSKAAKTKQFKSIVEKLLPFCSCENFRYIHCLRVLDLVVTFESQQPKEIRSEDFNAELFNAIHKELAGNLASRYHTVRQITAHLFDQFASELTFGDQSIYKIFYDIESIDTNIHTYREQLLLLQHIEPTATFLSALDKLHDRMKFDSLAYLLGFLHANFNLLWKPITELIAAYFCELNIEEFWSMYKAKIDETTQLQRCSSKQTDDIIDDDAFLEVGTCLNDVYRSIWRNCERPIDLVNYRILLWRNISSLGMLREIKNREIVTIFLDFIEHEYKRTIDRETLTLVAQRKRKQQKSRSNKSAVAPDPDDDDNDDEEQIIDDDQNVPAGTQRTLITMLQVFVNQNNPKQLHREPELWTLYMELLAHRNAAVQKLALDCVAAYKHKYLQPYIEHLHDLIDDGKFKTAIATFKIDKESGMVQPEHRPQLMPIVIRILFSKMLTRVGGQKTSNQTRKSLVMRFLGGCHETEILDMLHMSFWMFEHEFKDDALDMCQMIISKTNYSTVLSPNILQSSLDLLDVIQNEFGGLMSAQFLRYMVNVLLTIGSIVRTVIDQSHDEHSKFTVELSKPFKHLRNACLQNLHRFFDHFENYAWSDDEIAAIFFVFIAPGARKLPMESLMAVTPLLKLFTTFGKYPRLFVLLTRRIDAADDDDTTPLKYVMDLLVESKARPLVCLSIMEMIQNLLILMPDENAIALPALSQCQPIDEELLADISGASTLNFGSKILLPYLPNILQRFKMVLKGRRGLTKRDLTILSKITGLISDPETSKMLLGVLLPILVRKSSSNIGEEILMQMVETIINLFKRIEHPEHHIRSIAPMFQQITAIGPRKLLCSLLEIICARATNKSELEQTVRIVSDLNAWDRRWIEQPDYEKRLAAYKKIGELTATNQIDLNAGLLIVYHSFYFIKHDKDMALRDSAAYHLKAMLPPLIRRLKATKPKDLDYLIGTVILNLVRRTFRDQNTNVRNEGILLLGEIARECPDAHPVLADFNRLTCKTDREIDFFDNITHLQSQRHGKALLRFCSIAKTLDRAPCPRTLTQFILPLASTYIASDKYAANHGLITSAIETIGAVCRLLPWHQYESILKYYIKNMRFNVQYQKQMVRIVMHILDAFHFDLSKAQTTTTTIPKNESITDDLRSAAGEQTAENDASQKQGDNDDEDGEEVIVDLGTEHDNFYDELDELEQTNQENGDDGVDGDDDGTELPAKKVKICVYDKPIVLTQSIARKVVHNLATGLIPTLNNSITALSTYESFHKINKKKRRSEREEEEILRVPIALAVVKLLQKLPAGILEQNLNGILIKVCMFLRSPLISVRMTTRDILKNIMQTVGVTHLEMLLGHLTALLTRGFQVHVLTITVHALLDALKTSLKNGCMDKCLQHVLRVCMMDIFGESGQEKFVSKIGKRTAEAKPHNKSFLTLSICATNITQSCLLDLLLPFKEQLMRTQSKKNVIRVQECFQKIVAGLNINKQINIETMLMFIYGIISESIPDLMPEIKRPQLSADERQKIHQQRADCFLIPNDPAQHGRSNAVKQSIVTNVRANAHVLIEFGLELLQLTLKRGKLMKITYQPFIDPIVPILNESIGSSHVRVTTFALKCISTMISKQMETRRLNELTPAIVDKIFNILHKYVAANTDMLNENFLLVQSSFKTIVNILRYVPADSAFVLTADQLKTLLFYVEQYLNVNETTKQTIAFSLLKVIISRRLVTKELNNVLMQVGRLAIQSDSDVARAESKGIIVNYLMEYPLGKKIDGFLEFFITNLNYERQSGRESAIAILHSIAKRFPPKYLNRKAAIMFVACGSRLINDESTECRALVADCLETLLNRIDVQHRDELFGIVLTLLGDTKCSHREMAALLCTRFINAEKQTFSSRIEKVLPPLVTTLCTNSTGKYVRIAKQSNDNHDDDDDDDDDDAENYEDTQRMFDHQTIQLQNTLLKMLETFDDMIDNHSQYIDELAYESQKLLAHEHVWVRLNAMKTLQIILHTIDIDTIHSGIVSGATAGQNQLSYIYSNPEHELKSLTLDLCAQLIPEQTDSEMAQEATAILLLVANMVKDIPCGDATETDQPDEDAPTKVDRRKVNLPWLLRRLRYVVHAEVAKAPQSTILRTAIFKWIEGLVTLISTEQVQRLAYTLLTPLVREMSEEDQNVDAKLRKLAIRVGDAIRTHIGDDEYNLLRAQIQKKLLLKRAERKKSAAIEKISHPVQAAIRLKGIRERKKLAKRKNADPMKIHLKTKKKKKHANDEF